VTVQNHLDQVKQREEIECQKKTHPRTEDTALKSSRPSINTRRPRVQPMRRPHIYRPAGIRAECVCIKVMRLREHRLFNHPQDVRQDDRPSECSAIRDGHEVRDEDRPVLYEVLHVLRLALVGC
jgi:hypothetical protein